MMRGIRTKRYIVYFDYVCGEMVETVECSNKLHIKQVLQKKYGLSVKVRRVEPEE